MKTDLENEDISAQQLKVIPPLTTPGARLREARMAKKLKLEAVADQLNLTVPMLEQIERDEYNEKNLGITFLRGYLRAYSGLVDLDANEIVSEFNQLNLRDIPATMSTLRIYKRKKTSLARKSFSWLFTFFIIFLLLILIFWLHDKFSRHLNIINSANEKSVISKESMVAGNSIVPQLPMQMITNSAAKNTFSLSTPKVEILNN